MYTYEKSYLFIFQRVKMLRWKETLIRSKNLYKYHFKVSFESINSSLINVSTFTDK